MHRRYGDPLPLGEPGGLPYSKGLMARALVTAGCSIVRAYELAQRIELDLAERDVRSVDLERLDELAADVLGPLQGPQVVSRLRRYAALQSLDVPILLLVGGATGTGKSTVATEAAHRLGITRVTSTDFIRQTMRAFFSQEFMPSIHYSSFEAGQAVDDDEAGDPLVRGFLEQTRNVLVGVDGAIQRALREGWSMVLEGVHLVPGMVPRRTEHAIVVHAVLSVDNPNVHQTHFHVRDTATSGVRAMDKYLEQLEEIRRLQAYIVGRAEKVGVPVIESSNPERATAELMELVLTSVEELEPVV
jgi:2-phosphoglycerate kinase